MEKVIRFQIAEVQPQGVAQLFFQFQRGVACETVAYIKNVMNFPNSLNVQSSSQNVKFDS